MLPLVILISNRIRSYRFLADVKSYSDYYPFGMKMPGRYGSESSYRYGFNGAEKIDEAYKGFGNYYDLGARMYDARLARQLSLDPLMSDYPWQSPYVYHRNSPIVMVDYLGMGDEPPVDDGTAGKNEKKDGYIYHCDSYNASDDGWHVNEEDKSVVLTYSVKVNYDDNNSFLTARKKVLDFDIKPVSIQPIYDGKKQISHKVEIEYISKFYPHNTQWSTITLEGDEIGDIATVGLMVVEAGAKNIPSAPLIRQLEELPFHILDFALAGSGSTIKWLRVASVVKKSHVVEGVYDLGTTLGRYVGQSNNIPRRLGQHFGRGGKLSKGELTEAVLHSMPNSTKIEREVYEQYLIIKYGGPKGGKILNAVNPMGGRMDMYKDLINPVIEKFNLPR